MRSLCLRKKKGDPMTVCNKVCRICGVLDRDVRGNCKPCVKRRNLEFRSSDAGKAYLSVKHKSPKSKATNFWYKLRVKYGLSRFDYEDMLHWQGSRCGSCGNLMVGTRDTCVDHCHDTGEVRGLLCRGCNAAEGHLKSSPNRCEQLAAYLRRTHPGLR